MFGNVCVCVCVLYVWELVCLCGAKIMLLLVAVMPEALLSLTTMPVRPWRTSWMLCLCASAAKYSNSNTWVRITLYGLETHLI